MKHYLVILSKEENQFGFKDETDEVLDSDIEINEEDYLKCLDLNSKAKQFRLKENPTGNSLFDYIEEYTPEIVEEVQEPGLEEMVLDHEYRLSKFELGV